VKLANNALTKVRRRVTWDLRDAAGASTRNGPNRRRLLRGRERLSDKSFANMWNAIVSEDDTGQILSAWIAKEELRTLLSTVRVGGDPHLTRHRLHRFLTWCADSQIPELLTLAATVYTWRWPEINDRHRHHQRLHRGLQPPRQTGQTHRIASSETQTIRLAGYDFTAPTKPGTDNNNYRTPNFVGSKRNWRLLVIRYFRFRRIPVDTQQRIGRDVAALIAGLWPDQLARGCKVPRQVWQASGSTAGRVGGQQNGLDGIGFRLIACARP
jgi:Transposase